MDPDDRRSTGDPDRPSRLGLKAAVFGPLLVVVGVVVVALGVPGWVVVAALLAFVAWLLIDG